MKLLARFRITKDPLIIHQGMSYGIPTAPTHTQVATQRISKTTEGDTTLHLLRNAWRELDSERIRGVRVGLLQEVDLDHLTRTRQVVFFSPPFQPITEVFQSSSLFRLT
jgi:hypothetical protein